MEKQEKSGAWEESLDGTFEIITDENREQIQPILDKTEETPAEESVQEVEEESEQEPELVEEPESSEESKQEESEEEVEPSAFNVIYDDFKERGLFLVDDNFEFDGTEDSFEKAHIQTVLKLRDQAIDQAYQRLSPKQQAILKLGFGGVTDDDKVEQLSNITEVEGLSLDNVDNQKQVAETYFRMATRFSDARIKKEIQKMEDLDELKEFTEEVKPDITKFKEEEQVYIAQQQEQLEEQKRQIALKEKDIFMKQFEADEVSGVPVTTKDKQEIEQFMYTPVRMNDGTETTLAQYKLNQYLADPEKRAILALNLMRDFSNNTRKIKAKTKATKGLQEKLASLTETNSKIRGKNKRNKISDFNPDNAELILTD